MTFSGSTFGGSHEPSGPASRKRNFLPLLPFFPFPSPPPPAKPSEQAQLLRRRRFRFLRRMEQVEPQRRAFLAIAELFSGNFEPPADHPGIGAGPGHASAPGRIVIFAASGRLDQRDRMFE